MTVQIFQVNMEGHSGSFICDHCITARIFCLLRATEFEVDSCVSNMILIDSCVSNIILNIHWTCLVFGGIRQVGAYCVECFFCLRFELATAGPVLQDH